MKDNLYNIDRHSFTVWDSKGDVDEKQDAQKGVEQVLQHLD